MSTVPRIGNYAQFTEDLVHMAFLKISIYNVYVPSVFMCFVEENIFVSCRLETHMQTFFEVSNICPYAFLKDFFSVLFPKDEYMCPASDLQLSQLCLLKIGRI